MAIYITGDCHGNFRKVNYFCRYHETSLSDVMIVLGDAGINIWLAKTDWQLKEMLSELPITFFLVHGNHEQRPFLIEGYEEKEWNGGIVYWEKKYPNLLFAKDGEIYDFAGKKTVVLGGAYSVDKQYRQRMNLPWFESELPTKEIKDHANAMLEKNGWKVDYVLSHTCPYKYEPRDLFLDFIDQSTVDKTAEDWLTEIEKKLEYEKWFFGHFHENREYSKALMLYEEIRELGSDDFLQRIGRPKYKKGEHVLFALNFRGEEKEMDGRISGIDAFGTFGQVKEVSYDIMASDNVLYKHIVESQIEAVI